MIEATEVFSLDEIAQQCKTAQHVDDDDSKIRPTVVGQQQDGSLIVSWQCREKVCQLSHNF